MGVEPLRLRIKWQTPPHGVPLATKGAGQDPADPAAGGYTFTIKDTIRLFLPYSINQIGNSVNLFVCQSTYIQYKLWFIHLFSKQIICTATI